jgi:sialic acid synthase SpsE
VNVVKIGGREVGGACLITAELGTAHGGDLKRALRLTEAAAAAGADAVKLQAVFADEILHPAAGGVDLPGGRVDLYRRFQELERDADFYAAVREHARKLGLLFFCSVFGSRSLRLVAALEPEALKIASPEINHLPLLREAAGCGLPVILSGGVAALSDLERALTITGKNSLLLHCVTAYPAPEEEYNLKLIPSLNAVLGAPVGVSDHSLDAELVPALAVTVGAVMIEKHFTLSREGGGLDDTIAQDPEGLGRMCRAVRRAEAEGPQAALERLAAEHGEARVQAVLGSGVKRLAPAEAANYGRSNRSIHALVEIRAGEALNAENLCIVRSEKNLNPGLGPEHYDLVIGKTARRAVAAGAGLVWEDLLD